jgi:hypothetical protein
MSLLCRMETNAWPVWRAAARTLEDENDGVRQMAINFFTSPENDSAFLNQMPAGEKKKLLPVFLRALNSGGSGVCNNAAIALRYYPEEKPVVVPALAKALSDPQPFARLTVAESLTRMDPTAASQAGVAKVLAALVVHEEDQIAARAASALRKCHDDADEAVAALIKALHRSNSYVSSSASLFKPSQTTAIQSFPNCARPLNEKTTPPATQKTLSKVWNRGRSVDLPPCF